MVERPGYDGMILNLLNKEGRRGGKRDEEMCERQRYHSMADFEDLHKGSFTEGLTETENEGMIRVRQRKGERDEA